MTQFCFYTYILARQVVNISILALKSMHKLEQTIYLVCIATAAAINKLFQDEPMTICFTPGLASS